MEAMEKEIEALTKQVDDLQWELRDSQAECAGLRRLAQKLQAKTVSADDAEVRRGA